MGAVENFDRALVFEKQSKKGRANNQLQRGADAFGFAIQKFRNNQRFGDKRIANMLTRLCDELLDRSTPIKKRARRGYVGVVKAVASLDEHRPNKKRSSLEYISFLKRVAEKRYFNQVVIGFEHLKVQTKPLNKQKKINQIIDLAVFKLQDGFLKGPEKREIALDCLAALERVINKTSQPNQKIEKTYSGLLAAIMDARDTQAGYDGKPNKQIFEGQKLKGKTLILKEASGISVARVRHGRPRVTLPCPQGWFIHFKDAHGNIINGVQEYLPHFQGNGVKAPVGAKSVFIGLREGGNSFFDNEGIRPLHHGSTNGCTFKFVLK